MGTPLKHRLPGYSNEPKGKLFEYIHYGKCVRLPYANNDLWFVTIPMGWSTVRKMEYPYKAWGYPEEEHTFLVKAEHATISSIEANGRDVRKWKTVAHKVFVGAWCPAYECLFVDTPVLELTLDDGERVKYGYCRTQPDHSDRELWYVSFEKSPTYIVDHVFATHDFIKRMGSDRLKWLIIFWTILEHEVKWAELVTGQEGGGYVRNMTFSLAPGRRASVEALLVKIGDYERQLSEILHKYPRLKWDELSEDEKRRYFSNWKRDFGDDD
jgi:hypothetical protein